MRAYLKGVTVRTKVRGVVCGERKGSRGGCGSGADAAGSGRSFDQNSLCVCVGLSRSGVTGAADFGKSGGLCML